jgi:hypothetical protein
MHLILPAPNPLGLNEGAVLAALLFKSKIPPAGGAQVSWALLSWNAPPPVQFNQPCHPHVQVLSLLSQSTASIWRQVCLTSILAVEV